MKTILQYSFALLLLAIAQLHASDKLIVLVAGRPSHGPGYHEFNAGCMLLQQCLEPLPGIRTILVRGGWPEDESVFDQADAIFLYMDGGGGHPAIHPDRLKLLESLMAKGVGLGCAHYAVEVPKGDPGQAWQQFIGGHYEHLFSCNPMWSPEFKSFPNHPITRGVKPFALEDEWYFNMRFRPNLSDITPILTAVPSDDVRDGPYVYPKGPYPHIVENSGRPETMMWALERADGGRGFGFTGGHVHRNWGNDDYRKVVLNAILWIAKAEIPCDGVVSTVSEDFLAKNLDPKGK